MSADGKVLICRLFERQSARGNRYLTGRLGAAKLIALLDTEAELQFGATGCFNVFVQSGEDRKPDGDAGRQAQQPRRPPSDSSSAPPPGRIQRHQRSDAKPKPAHGRPFHDDPISGIGRSG
jgi:hypothetical protein